MTKELELETELEAGGDGVAGAGGAARRRLTERGCQAVDKSLAPCNR